MIFHMVTKKLHSCSADWMAGWCTAMPFVLGKTEKTQDSYLHCLWATQSSTHATWLTHLNKNTACLGVPLLIDANRMETSEGGFLNKAHECPLELSVSS